MQCARVRADCFDMLVRNHFVFDFATKIHTQFWNSNQTSLVFFMNKHARFGIRVLEAQMRRSKPPMLRDAAAVAEPAELQLGAPVTPSASFLSTACGGDVGASNRSAVNKSASMRDLTSWSTG